MSIDLDTNRSLIKHLLSCFAFIILIPISVPVISQQSIEESSPEGQISLEELRAFVQVFEQLRQGYVEELTDAEIFEMAVWGILSELDPHSEFLNLERLNEVEESAEGRFQGIGVELTMEDDFLTVVSPIDDSPAARAGVKPGDIILRINGISTEGLSFRQSLQLLDNNTNEAVQLTLDRLSANDLIEVELVREAISLQSVRSRVVAENVGYLRVTQFQQNTADQFREHLENLLDTNPLLAGLIIDLRNNPGGLLRSSIEITDMFLDSGLVVSTQGRIEDANREFYATPGTLADELPIIILINRGSASASEIVAGALQDHKRALILGDTSFGKGSVQEVLNIDETRAIKLTIARYYTPSGRSIQAQGIYPDIRIDQGEVNWNTEQNPITEAQLSRHLSNGSDESQPQIIGVRETLSDIEDVQLAHAVSLLQGSILLNQQSR